MVYGGYNACDDDWIIYNHVLRGQRRKITAIKLEVKDNLQLGSALDEEDELEIETSADSYGVAEWEIDNEGFTWNSEHKPRVKVTVTADDDYYFPYLRIK